MDQNKIDILINELYEVGIITKQELSDYQYSAYKHVRLFVIFDKLAKAVFNLNPKQKELIRNMIIRNRESEKVNG